MCFQKYFVDAYMPVPIGFEPNAGASSRLSRTEITTSANSVTGMQPRNLLQPGEFPDIERHSTDETRGALADALQSNVGLFGSRGDTLYPM